MGGTPSHQPILALKRVAADFRYRSCRIIEQIGHSMGIPPARVWMSQPGWQYLDQTGSVPWMPWRMSKGWASMGFPE